MHNLHVLVQRQNLEFCLVAAKRQREILLRACVEQSGISLKAALPLQLWHLKVPNLIYHPQHRAWLFLLHRKSLVHSSYLSLFFRPICKTQRVEHELVQGFCNNSLPCKQMTTLSRLRLVSAQLVMFPFFFRMKILTKISGLRSGFSSEFSSIESISQLVPKLCSPTSCGESPSIPRYEWQREIDQIISRQNYCDIQK